MGDAGAPIVENQWNQPVEFKGPEPWLRLEFRGQGSEYFRVWIVNVLLSVVTLGIYSAWATVRNRRYFCGNTFLDDSHFDFHGDPRAILVGRVIAIFLLAGYAGGGYLHPAAPAVTLLLIAVMMPWLIVRSLRFRYRNTSYRNLRFNFVGDARQAYGIFGTYFVVALLAVAVPAGLGWLIAQEKLAGIGLFLGMIMVYFLIYPAFIHRLTTFTTSHSAYGDTYFAPDLKRPAYFGFFLGSLGVGLVAVMAAGIGVAIIGALTGAFAGYSPGGSAPKFAAPLIALIILPAYMLPYAFWQVLTSNYLFNNTQLGPVRFRSNMTVFGYWGILITNTLLVVTTLGLAFPWAKVRMARYRVESLAYQGDLEGFEGSLVRDRGAAGDEIGDAFDIDLVGI